MGELSRALCPGMAWSFRNTSQRDFRSDGTWKSGVPYNWNEPVLIAYVCADQKRLNWQWHRRVYSVHNSTELQEMMLARLLVSIVMTIVSLLTSPLRSEAHENIDTLRELFSVLQSCWIPPSIERAFAGAAVLAKFSLNKDGGLVGEPRIVFLTHRAPQVTEKVYRDAVISALGRCLPLPLSDRLGGAVAGRPLTIRFVDQRQKLRQTGINSFFVADYFLPRSLTISCAFEPMTLQTQWEHVDAATLDSAD